jgi:hypothetical protein
MGKAASKLGWLIFIGALVGAAFRTGPDDPMTAGMKSSGLYEPFMVTMSIIFLLTLIYIARLMRKTVSMRRHLDEPKKKGR